MCVIYFWWFLCLLIHFRCCCSYLQADVACCQPKFLTCICCAPGPSPQVADKLAAIADEAALRPLAPARHKEGNGCRRGMKIMYMCMNSMNMNTIGGGCTPPAGLLPQQAACTLTSMRHRQKQIGGAAAVQYVIHQAPNVLPPGFCLPDFAVFNGPYHSRPGFYGVGTCLSAVAAKSHVQALQCCQRRQLQRKQAQKKAAEHGLKGC